MRAQEPVCIPPQRTFQDDGSLWTCAHASTGQAQGQQETAGNFWRREGWSMVPSSLPWNCPICPIPWPHLWGLWASCLGQGPLHPWPCTSLQVLMTELLPLVRTQERLGLSCLALCRAVHSLLCEGGERFLTILRDEPAD